MKYIYYPGCSLDGTALEYNISTRATMQAVGAQLVELDDWTCCGASAAEATSYLLSISLAARNLALGERMNVGADFLVPCSACYVNLSRVGHHVKQDPELLDRINDVLGEEGLAYNGGTTVRHLLDVVANDISPEIIKVRLQRSLSGLRAAPYYGCQALRPYGTYDHPERPRSMEPIIEAIGAEVHHWTMGAKCCGASLMSTERDVALEHVGAILAAARGADCIVTVCPMCQMNLEAYQAKASKRRAQDLQISILYLPQLLGLALGLSEKDVRLDLNLALMDSLRDKLDA